MEQKRLEAVPLKQVQIRDKFWNRYIRLVKEVLIPYQWDILNDRLEGVETSHCIKNFEIAAGEEKAISRGRFFRIQMWRNGWRQSLMC